MSRQRTLKPSTRGTTRRKGDRDRGDTMLMTVILIGFLMVGSLTLINASDAWGHRRGSTEADHPDAGSMVRSSATAEYGTGG